MSKTIAYSRISPNVVDIDTWNPQHATPDDVFDYVDIASVDRERKAITATTRTQASEAPSRARQVLKAGDVLVSTVRPNLNAVALVPEHLTNAIASTGFCVLRCHPKKLDQRYLFYWVRTNQFVADMVRQATGASYPAVSDRIIKESEIPLPPLSEQKRIADILDKADAIRRKRREAERCATDLVTAAFIDTFGDPVTNPKNWKLAALPTITKRLTVGIVVKPASYYVDDGVPALRSLNVRTNRIATENVVYLSRTQNEGLLAKTRVWKGDILLVRSGQPGTAAVVPQELDGVNAIDVLIVTPDFEQVTSQYLCYMFNSPAGKRLVLGEQRGQIQKHLNVGSLKTLEIPLPPIHMQRAFNGFLLKNTSLQGRLAGTRTASDYLFNSLVQRAFKGEL